jgi:hypothetical protein
MPAEFSQQLRLLTVLSRRRDQKSLLSFTFRPQTRATRLARP